MENRVESSRADLVPMPGQLLRHPGSKYPLMISMVKNVKANHSGVQVAAACIGLHHRTSLSQHDITRTSKLGKPTPGSTCLRGQRGSDSASRTSKMFESNTRMAARA